jgi:hypothetical protein
VALVRTDVSEERRAYIFDASCEEILCHSVHRLVVTATIVPSSPILVTLMIEALRSSELLVLTGATQLTADGVLHSYRRENPLSYIKINVTAYFLCSISISNKVLIRKKASNCTEVNTRENCQLIIRSWDLE